MKLGILALIMSFSTLTMAQQKGGADIGSAFVNNGILYVTVLGDCNNIHGDLIVEPLCLADRMTMNYQTECEATLSLLSTKRGCPSGERIARVLEINLKDSKLTQEAELLKFKIVDQEIVVKVK